MLTTDNIRRLRLARLFYNEATDLVRVDHETRSAAGATALQDAVEMALLVLAETLGVTIPARSDFDRYFTLINERIGPQTLPLHSQMMRLNRIRVQAKHGGVFPQHTEVANLVPVVRAFLDEICAAHLGVDFSTLNLSSQIGNAEQRAFVEEAERELASGNYLGALIAARKAFYLAFEKSADIRKFSETDENDWFSGFGSTAPSYARNRAYISNNVRDAFGYIVLDHSKIDSDLVKDGIDPVVFWNVWRITPNVYLWDDGGWAVKHELLKTEREDLQSDAVHVVEAIADILLRREERSRRHRLIPYGRRWTLPMKAGAQVYVNADATSNVVHTFDAAATVDVTAETVGLDGSGGWWSISSYTQEPYFSGFVREEDVDRSGGQQ